MLNVYLNQVVAFMAIGAMKEIEAREALKGQEVRQPQDVFISQAISYAQPVADLYQWATENNCIGGVFCYDVSEWIGQSIASLLADDEPINTIALLQLCLTQDTHAVIDWQECPLFNEVR